ncbi:MAG TPA: type VI secretion system tube protein Hcp [Quisquiliibacterium sp.]|nr:type VI secretion system tube protein Hcp [Quisquiliibacterium sp.]HPA89670.1 type VI secretion system tube protein Hcp [Quisquiliibacterium sp.]HQD82468.1 type VI secretion system tube protein Hcp [Quisquiliibacterium sp.]HQN13052.1 type VI secretion system tube protein Hcp [Quisquiliibacterium sp.]HQP66312.1 type VI secretion system tube protein Hcp [Quisquiliibacterium sp.]
MKGDCFFRIQDKKFDVRGEAEDTTYAGWIQVEEWNWGMNNRAVSAGFQEGKLRGDVREFVFAYRVDASSAAMLQICNQNAVLEKAELAMRRAGGEAQLYVEIKFTKVQVKSVDLVHDEHNLIPLQRVAISFESAEFVYTPQSQAGAKRSGGHSFEWRAPAR